jgi:uncharacterized membrane protein
VATEAPRRPWSPPRPDVGVLAGLVGLYVAVFGTLTWRQQSNFGTFGYDMGIYDQGIWLLSRFQRPFSTVRGLTYFGHHVNIVTLLFVPAYWLGAGPHFLYAAETAWMAAGAVPIWLLARDRLGDGWLALPLAGAYLLYPSLEWINWWHFHPDALIITPLLFAYWLATRRRWAWFAVAAGTALLAKEDAALALVVLGLVVAVRWSWVVGLTTSAAGAGWFFLCTRVVLPHLSGETFYSNFFSAFGNSVGSIMANMVLHPSRVARLAFKEDRLTYYRQLLAPVGFLPLAALPVLLIGAPQVLVNVVSDHNPTHDIRYHYSSIVVAAVFLATVEACALLGRSAAARRFLVGAVAATALATNVAWSPSPIGVKFHSGIWAGYQPRHREVNAALRLVPRSAGVSATYYLVPHLTHRRLVYEFPNPFKVVNWGVHGEHPGRPADVDVVVLDTTLNGDQQRLYESLVAPDGAFSVVYDRDGIVVARRRTAGSG